jgi:hypothetical protein
METAIGNDAQDEGLLRYLPENTRPGNEQEMHTYKYGTATKGI